MSFTRELIERDAANIGQIMPRQVAATLARQARADRDTTQGPTTRSTTTTTTTRADTTVTTTSTTTTYTTTTTTFDPTTKTTTTTTTATTIPTSSLTTATSSTPNITEATTTTTTTITTPTTTTTTPTTTTTQPVAVTTTTTGTTTSTSITSARPTSSSTAEATTTTHTTTTPSTASTAKPTTTTTTTTTTTNTNTNPGQGSDGSGSSADLSATAKALIVVGGLAALGIAIYAGVNLYQRYTRRPTHLDEVVVAQNLTPDQELKAFLTVNQMPAIRFGQCLTTFRQEMEVERLDRRVLHFRARSLAMIVDEEVDIFDISLKALSQTAKEAKLSPAAQKLLTAKITEERALTERRRAMFVDMAAGMERNVLSVVENEVSDQRSRHHIPNLALNEAERSFENATALSASLTDTARDMDATAAPILVQGERDLFCEDVAECLTLMATLDAETMDEIDREAKSEMHRQNTSGQRFDPRPQIQHPLLAGERATTVRETVVDMMDAPTQEVSADYEPQGFPLEDEDGGLYATISSAGNSLHRPQDGEVALEMDLLQRRHPEVTRADVLPKVVARQCLTPTLEIALEMARIRKEARETYFRLQEVRDEQAQLYAGALKDSSVEEEYDQEELYPLATARGSSRQDTTHLGQPVYDEATTEVDVLYDNPRGEEGFGFGRLDDDPAFAEHIAGDHERLRSKARDLTARLKWLANAEDSVTQYLENTSKLSEYLVDCAREGSVINFARWLANRTEAQGTLYQLDELERFGRAPVVGMIERNPLFQRSTRATAWDEETYEVGSRRAAPWSQNYETGEDFHHQLGGGYAALRDGHQTYSSQAQHPQNLYAALYEEDDYLSVGLDNVEVGGYEVPRSQALSDEQMYGSVPPRPARMPQDRGNTPSVVAHGVDRGYEVPRSQALSDEQMYGSVPLPPARTIQSGSDKAKKVARTKATGRTIGGSDNDDTSS